VIMIYCCYDTVLTVNWKVENLFESIHEIELILIILYSQIEFHNSLIFQFGIHNRIFSSCATYTNFV